MFASSSILALFLFLQALSASTALHHVFHADAGHAEHQCAVTLLSDGQVDASETNVGLPVPLVSVALVQLPSLPVREAVDYLLLPGRAPPSLVS